MIHADLHIHTHYSDGAHSPAYLAEMARDRGVELISLTDHDTLEGLPEKRAAAEREGLLFVSGWEVSAYVGDVKVHVLGYGCEQKEEYRAFAEERKRSSLIRAEESLKKANALLGLHVTLEDALRERKKEDVPLHTMHVVHAVARKLNMKRGKVYETYFAGGMPAYSGYGRPSPEEAIEVIHACGGIAVLAHPGRIPMEHGAREELMDRLVERGLNGIECTHTQHTEGETEYFLSYAGARGLLKTGGSDFHAEGTERAIGSPPFYADDALLAALKLRPLGSK